MESEPSILKGDLISKTRNKEKERGKKEAKMYSKKLTVSMRKRIDKKIVEVDDVLHIRTIHTQSMGIPCDIEGTFIIISKRLLEKGETGLKMSNNLSLSGAKKDTYICNIKNQDTDEVYYGISEQKLIEHKS